MKHRFEHNISNKVIKEYTGIEFKEQIFLRLVCDFIKEIPQEDLKKLFNYEMLTIESVEQQIVTLEDQELIRNLSISEFDKVSYLYNLREELKHKQISRVEMTLNI